MTLHGAPVEDGESIDPRYFARRAHLDHDDESIAPRPVAPAPVPVPDPIPDDDPGIAAPAGDGGLGVPVATAGPDSDSESLAVVDYFQRRKRGENASLGEYPNPDPELSLSRSLASQITRHNAFRNLDATGSSQGATLRLPDVGDVVFDFRLKHALGKGAFARVFLAGQGHLAGRPVVLKVSAIEGTEPQTLAQLQHTNIVPIYSVHEDSQAGLRAVCMPYFGGASLSAVLKELFAASPVPRQGHQFVKALEAVQAPAPDRDRNCDRPGAAAGQTPRDTLAGLDYVRTTLWIAARLAEGLQHAHQRGVLHRDIKPSNILISAEGQALLLDFNLAHDQNADPVHATIGGTIAFMAPEHLRAILAQSPDQARLVDHRSDIYSLGMVIAEMLTGHNPFEQSASYSAFPLQIEAMALDRSKGAPSVRAVRPDIPWGLESILRTCLAPDPAQRYQQTEHLAEDLRRLLEDRPLRYAPELSLAERGRKWARRHPRLTAAGTVTAVAGVALVTLATAVVGLSRHLESTRHHLGAFQARDRLAAHDAGTTEALTLVNTVIERDDLLHRGLAVCERTLALYDPPPGSAPAQAAHPDWARLGPVERLRVAEDRRELLLLSAGARVQLAPGDRAALRDALARLDRAEAIPGLEPSRALGNDRARYLALIGDAPGARAAQRRADLIPAHTARDHYLLATSHARRGGPAAYDRAIDELNQALRINPRHYWSLVLRGVCFLEKGDHVAAAGDFGLCAGLRPDLVWGYFNRGYVLDHSGRKAAAIEDYTTAIARDPRFVPARINRGMALLQLRRYAGALADFDHAWALAHAPGNSNSSGAASDSTLSAARGMALEGLGRHEQADAEFARALTLSAQGPTSGADRTRLLWTYGFAVSSRLPAKAEKSFQEVLDHDPRHPQALYGLAMLAMTQERSEQAVAYFNQAVQAAPDLVEARRYRAVALARCSAWDQASRDIHWCLDREPDSGETLYAAACVSARAAGQLGTPETFRQSIALLRQALDRGVGRDRFATDPDLEALRNQPEFERLGHH
jgi:serine/threonine protein kinase/Tfp pilus assembly protein PilF